MSILPAKLSTAVVKRTKESRPCWLERLIPVRPAEATPTLAPATAAQISTTIRPLAFLHHGRVNRKAGTGRIPFPLRRRNQGCIAWVGYGDLDRKLLGRVQAEPRSHLPSQHPERHSCFFRIGGWQQ